MNYKKYIPIILIMLSITMLLGTSYALLRSTNKGENLYTMNVGLLEVTFQDNETNTLTVENMIPVTDSEGMNYENELSFTIKNTGTLPAKYNVYIEETSTNPEFKNVIRFISNKNETGYNNPKTLGSDYYIDTEATLEVGETATYKVKCWLDYSADATYMNKIFTARIVVETEMGEIKTEPTFVDVLKERVGNGGLVAINTEGTLYDETDTTEEIREYRYSGLDVNNYVFFDTNGDGIKTNDEIWRIVGIFKDTIKDEDGNVVLENGQPTYEEKVKLMRNTVLTTSELPASYTINGITSNIESGTTGYVYWNYTKTGTNYNDWTTASIQYYLNTEQDESSTPKKGYLSVFNEDAKNLLSLTTYHLGNFIWDTDTAIKAYQSERNNSQIWPGNQPTWDGYVGLLYPSDYGYSAINNYWTTALYSYNSTAYQYSWMQQNSNHSSYEWFISPSYDYDNYASRWTGGGHVYSGGVNVDKRGIRSVVNLISAAILYNNDATGTQNDPYVIKINEDYEYIPAAVELLKTKLGTGGLVAVNTSGTLYNGTDTIREYRYSGPTVNNYVFFDTNGDRIKTNDEIWRIVGIFDDKVKLMRNTVLTSAELPTSYKINGTTNTIENGTSGEVYWNYELTGTNYNDWTRAGLQYYLNTEHDESSTLNPGYLSFLTEEAKDLVSLTTYYLGNTTDDTVTAVTSYTSERNTTQIHSGNQSSWNGYVGLLYPSDYGYSTTNTYWTTIMWNYNDGASNYSWMQKTANHDYAEWLISPDYYNSFSVNYWDYDTYGYGGETRYLCKVRPVISLKSSSHMLDAAGTLADPYVVVIE